MHAGSVLCSMLIREWMMFDAHVRVRFVNCGGDGRWLTSKFGISNCHAEGGVIPIEKVMGFVRIGDS